MSSLFGKGSSWKPKESYSDDESDGSDDAFSSSQTKALPKRTSASTSIAKIKSDNGNASSETSQPSNGIVCTSNKSRSSNFKKDSNAGTQNLPLALDSDSDEESNGPGGSPDDLFTRMKRKADALMDDLTKNAITEDAPLLNATPVVETSKARSGRGKSKVATAKGKASKPDAFIIPDDQPVQEPDPIAHARHLLNTLASRKNASQSQNHDASPRASDSIVEIADDDEDCVTMSDILPTVLTAAERAKLMQAPTFSLDLLASELGVSNYVPNPGLASAMPIVNISALGTSAEGSASSAANVVKLKTRLNGKLEWRWSIVTTDPLSKLKAKFCEKYGVSIEEARFELDGEELEDEDTAAAQDLEDDCLIDVSISASLFRTVLERDERNKALEVNARASSNSAVGSVKSGSSNYKAAALSEDNRIKVTFQLTVEALVAQSGAELKTELKAYTDMTLKHIHDMIVKRQVIRPGLADVVCYTLIERDSGKVIVLNPSATLLDLRINDGSSIIARLPNIKVLVKLLWPQASVKEFEVRANPAVALGTFLAQLSSCEFIQLPHKQLLMSMVASEEVLAAPANGRGKAKGKTRALKGTPREVDLMPEGQGLLRLHDVGFVEGSVVHIRLK